MKYQRTGEFRAPRQGEWFECVAGGGPAMYPDFAEGFEPRWILKEEGGNESPPTFRFRNGNHVVSVIPLATSSPWGKLGFHLCLTESSSHYAAVTLSCQQLIMVTDGIKELLEEAKP